MAWVEDVGGTGEIYFAGSRNGGETFSAPLNLSGSAADSTSPVIGADGSGHVYLAWAEEAFVAPEIYFRTGPGGSDLSQTPGTFLESLRDVDGDGYDDLLIGARGDEHGLGGPGNAYLYYGGPGILQGSPEKIAFPGFQNGDRFGGSVALGDINGDGNADLIIGAPEDGDAR
ncbi:MAG: VCBS repeat-containing protein, partial [Nitrospirae bacterium]|nr:VCBS repeat-containing protein [Nitrospirota bacterium]